MIPALARISCIRHTALSFHPTDPFPKAPAPAQAMEAIHRTWRVVNTGTAITRNMMAASKTQHGPHLIRQGLPLFDVLIREMSNGYSTATRSLPRWPAAQSRLARATILWGSSRIPIRCHHPRQQRIQLNEPCAISIHKILGENNNFR